MNSSCSNIRNREILHLSGLGIEARNFIRDSEIRDPHIAVLVGSGAEGHTARARHVVFDVNDIHGFTAEGPDRFFVSRHIRRGSRQHGLGPEKTGQVRRNLVGFLIAEVRAQENTEMHGVAHKRDAVFPAVGVPRDGSHAALKLMTNIAMGDKQVLPFCRLPELFRLRLGNFIPADGAFLQSEIKRGVLVRCESDGIARIGAIADGLYKNAIISGSEIRNSVASLSIGKHDDRNSGLRVLGLDKCALTRRAIRTVHGAGDCGPVARRAEKNNYAQESKNFSLNPHPLASLPVLYAINMRRGILRGESLNLCSTAVKIPMLAVFSLAFTTNRSEVDRQPRGA